MAVYVCASQDMLKAYKHLAFSADLIFPIIYGFIPMCLGAQQLRFRTQWKGVC